MSLRPTSRFARFVVVGAANTAFSYLVYLLLLQFIDYRLAYTVAYVLGTGDRLPGERAIRL